MPSAIRIHEHGGPEVLRWEPVEVGEPGPGEIRLRHTAAGLNYIDVYFRTGLYPVPSLPCILGKEGVGIVEAVGEGVSDLKPGDRVAYVNAPLGSYAEERLYPAEHAVPLPDSIDDQTAAAILLKGMTAEYLLHQTHRVRSGDTILFHAAAGGVGLLACQWAKHIGATVIGTVGSREKAELARAHGCDHPIVYREESFVERVHEITGGKGVSVVYDSVGRDTFMQSLDCLQSRGHIVSFGQSSGPVEPLDIGVLAQKGSLTLTRPSLFHYVGTRDDLMHCANALFDVVTSGAVKIEIGQTFAMKDAARAHEALENRETHGATVLLP